MRVIVCGGRDYEDKEHVFRVLDALHEAHGITVVIHGGARGADTLADWWAASKKVDRVEVQAEWGEHGRKAGPMRNRRMLRECAPDMVVAFPGGIGTSNMVTQAIAAGVRVESHEVARKSDVLPLPRAWLGERAEVDAWALHQLFDMLGRHLEPTGHFHMTRREIQNARGFMRQVAKTYRKV